ncbi:hypothetical protein N0V85_002900 [Neurospora sp. IMI 360204]|nr:hypothetical protein N0V85_002900 [Neurospora sp. IMI 360204]
MGQQTLEQQQQLPQQQHPDLPKCESPSHAQQNVQDDAVTEFDLDRLGRQRSAVFSSTLEEVMFCGSILISMLMSEYFVSGFNIILPGIAGALDIPKESQTWPSSVFSLVTGSFLLPFGRLADMYGAYFIFTGGLAWMCIWCLIGGFSQNYQMLIVTRALAGLGPAAFLPTGLMLLGTTYRPGPRKNLVFSLYSAFAPLGFFIGIILGGVTGEYLSWRWWFFIGTIILFVTGLMAYLTIPNDRHQAVAARGGAKMDYLGLFTIVPAIILITFAITTGGSASSGWRTPYIPITFVIGMLFLGAAIYIEGWVAEQPLLPRDLFAAKYMKRFTLALFFAYGVFGIFLFYASLHIEAFMGASTLQTATWFAPMAGGGIVLATIGGFTLHKLPGRVLLMISGCGCLASVLLFALIPDHANYWAFVFPAMLGATIGVDITYLVSNVFITTNVPSHRQGTAGALINSLVFIGISFFLGLADLAVAESEGAFDGENHRVAFWLAVACAACSLLLFCLVDPGKAESELTLEERMEAGLGPKKEPTASGSESSNPAPESE